MPRPLVLACLVLLLVPASAQASQQFGDVDVSNVSLAVNEKHEALVTYTRRDGSVRHVLAWGAINARDPDARLPQVRFRLDYTGGLAKYGARVFSRFANACRPYDGPPLVMLVAACKAPDGSYWALQSWQTPLPDLGFAPWLPEQRAWELHVSHWTGPLAQLEVHADWIYGGRFHDLFGRLTYRGKPVYGYRTTRYGAPLDGYGRLLYLDTYDSAYGRGWRRENSFVAHNPTGVFCYGF